ncbi:MAG TPA: MBL fold metallo-hydrolase [Pseudolabrys sp.]|nr:MBL fold metallo-hydrolase [Pseudolabrys sp.]
MRVWVLGSGTPTPSLQRMCSGYLVQLGSRYIVFDHGFGAHHRLLELGVRATQVSHLFFTHLHYDHMGDYPRLLLTRWDQGGGRVPDLKVYGPPPLRHITERLFAEDGAFGPDLRARTSDQCSLDLYRARGGVGERKKPAPIVAELGETDVVKEDDWELRVAPVCHFAPYLNSYAYRLTYGGRSLVYSGDTGPTESLVRLAASCDVLIHMCHYLSGTAPSEAFARSCTGHLELAQMAREAKVRTLVLTHITEQIDRPGVRERVVGEMAEIFKGDILFGNDLLEVPITGAAAGKLD